MKYFKFAFILIVLASAVCALLDVRLAHAAAPGHRVVHPWRQVERLNDGSFAFMGSDNIWYHYSQQNGATFVPSCIPDVFVLPKNGYWTTLSAAPAADTVVETENAIVQWTNVGAPADLQSQDYVCDAAGDAG